MARKEIIDVFDELGNVIGTMSREEAEHHNHLTENVLVFLFNSKGDVWTQLRPMSKKHYPGLWDISACGGVVSGESHLLAASRETQEETGLTATLTYAESFLNIFKGDDGIERKRLSHIYWGVTDEEPHPNEEVDEFKLWDVAHLRSALHDNPSAFIPSFEVELNKALDAKVSVGV